MNLVLSKSMIKIQHSKFSTVCWEILYEYNQCKNVNDDSNQTFFNTSIALPFSSLPWQFPTLLNPANKTLGVSFVPTACLHSSLSKNSKTVQELGRWGLRKNRELCVVSVLWVYCAAGSTYMDCTSLLDPYLWIWSGIWWWACVLFIVYFCVCLQAPCLLHITAHVTQPHS